MKFPDGKIDEIPACGLRSLGDSVGDYIYRIKNAELLAAIIFDYRTEKNSFHAAASRLINLKGISHVSHLLAERRKADPSAFSNSELAVLAELMRSPYITIQVARITPEDMPPDKAELVLRQMSKELDAGTPWARVYEKFADLNPDLRDRKTNPNSIRTLIGYLHDGTFSPTGFDILTYRTAENLPLEHLRELFGVQRGRLIMRSAGGVYLYHIKSYYNGLP